MSDQEYVIDIAANLDGAATISELDEITAKLTGAGRRSDEFQSAVKRLTSDLDAAKSASAEAAAALAAGSDQYKILEREAIRAGKALEKSQGKGSFDPRAVRSAHEANTALDAYTSTLRGLEKAADSASGKQDKLAKSLSNLNKVGAHADQANALANQKYEKLQAAVSRLPGPLGAVGGQLVGSAKAANGVSMAFGESETATLAIAAATVVAAAAVVALTAAFVAGAVSLTVYAVTQADAAREMNLTREAFSALSEGAELAVSSFDKVTDATGMSDAGLLALSKRLLATKKIFADEMPEALFAAALAEQALGQGGADEFIDRIKAGTLTVGAFANEAEAKFGGVVAKRLMGLAQQSAKFSRLWRDLFADINIEPVLTALGILVDMFDKANPLAQALGFAIDKAFAPVSDNAVAAAYAVEAFALDVTISLVKLYLAARTFADVFETIAYVLGAVVVGLGILVGIVLAAVAAVGLFVAGVFALGYGLGVALIAVVQFMADVGTGFAVWLSELIPRMAQMGVDLIMGLVNGITSAVSAVVDAVKHAVGSAIDAAKDVLGIASPSKVFAEIGMHTVAGFTGAVDAGAPDAQGSMASLVDPTPVAASSSGAGGGATGGGRGAAFDFTSATFNFHGVKDAEQARGMFSEMLTRLLEDDADSLGGAEAPA